MRGYFVDERDSAWERDAARYRIYTFEGAPNAVTTYDPEGATLEEALDTASAMSGADERLWSLALVENDARGLRGLIWLSGMDYYDPPGSAREWQRRRQMQGWYLAARSRRGPDQYAAERVASHSSAPRLGRRVAPTGELLGEVPWALTPDRGHGVISVMPLP